MQWHAQNTSIPKRDALERQIEALAPPPDAPELANDTWHAIRAFTEDIRRGLDNVTSEEKQRLLRLLVDRIEVNPNADGGTLYGVIPLPQQDSTGLRPSYRDGCATTIALYRGSDPFPLSAVTPGGACVGRAGYARIQRAGSAASCAAGSPAVGGQDFLR